LSLPLKSGIADGCLSIAVIHHLATKVNLAKIKVLFLLSLWIRQLMPELTSNSSFHHIFGFSINLHPAGL
jgi:hypothetical protein